MSAKQDYTVNADGWVAGKLCFKGDPVQLSPSAAKYENVTLKPKAPPKGKGASKPTDEAPASAPKASAEKADDKTERAEK